MNVVLLIPDDLAGRLGESGAVTHQALEVLTVESYRAHRLTKASLRRLLGLRSRFEVDAFLTAHEVFEPIEPDEVERRSRVSNASAPGRCHAASPGAVYRQPQDAPSGPWAATRCNSVELSNECTESQRIPILKLGDT